jgi:hypothetical protein
LTISLNGNLPELKFTVDGNESIKINMMLIGQFVAPRIIITDPNGIITTLSGNSISINNNAVYLYNVGTSLFRLSNLPTSPTGLDTGFIYNSSGTLKII